MPQEPQQKTAGQNSQDQREDTGGMGGDEQAFFVQAGAVEPEPQQNADAAAKQGEQRELVVFQIKFHENTFLSSYTSS